VPDELTRALQSAGFGKFEGLGGLLALIVGIQQGGPLQDFLTQPEYADFFSRGGIGTIWAEVSRDPRNDIGSIIVRRVEAIVQALGADPEFFGLTLEATGGFTEFGFFDKVIEFFETRAAFIKNLDTLSGTPITTAAQQVSRLSELFTEMRSIAEGLGFTIEELNERYKQGISSIESRFLIGLESQFFQIQLPFMATLEQIRVSTEDLLRNAQDLGVGLEDVMHLNFLQVGEALEQALKPVQDVIDAIQLDQAAPLETLEILEAKFIAALATNDPGQVASTATALLSQTEKTFGRTDDFFETSAEIEAQLLAFNEKMADLAQVQLDLVERTYQAIVNDTETTASLLNGIWETLNAIRLANEAIPDPASAVATQNVQEMLAAAEARFAEARTGTDPYEFFQSSIDLLSATEGAYGRSDVYYERSAFVESSIAAFADRLSEQNLLQTDVAQQQLLATQVGNEVTAQLLQSILEAMIGIREDNEEIFDALDLANAKKVA
jgi:hypothetical protein